ncbi:hypothetical protein SERLA73DRAFT_34772, partial [Serpula lacrymans var. lacrymans S7.3]
KTNCGFENEITAELLCPAEYQWNEECVYSLFQCSVSHTTSSDLWPNFLFGNNRADVGDLKKGLFRGHLLVKAYLFLFTSPTSAD